MDFSHAPSSAPNEARTKLNSLKGGCVFLWSVFNLSFWKQQLHGDRINSPVRDGREGTIRPRCDFFFLPRYSPLTAPMSMALVVGKHMGNFPKQTFLFGPDGSLIWEEKPTTACDEYHYQKQCIQHYFDFTYLELLERVKPLAPTTGLTDMVLLMVHYPKGQGLLKMRTEIEVLSVFHEGYMTPPGDGSWHAILSNGALRLERRILAKTEFRLWILVRKPAWVEKTTIVDPKAPREEKTRFFWDDDPWTWSVPQRAECICLGFKIVTGEVVSVIKP